MPLLEEVLSLVGLDAETIAKVQANDTTINATDLHKGITEGWRAKAIADEDFIKSIPVDRLPKNLFDEVRSSTKSEVFGIASKALREELGVTEEEYKAMPDEMKKNINQFTKQLARTFKEKASTNPDYSKLQQENGTLKTDLEKLKLEIESMPAKYEAEFNGKLSAIQSEQKAFATLSGLQANLPVDASLLFPSLYGQAKATYGWKNENGELVATKIDNDAFPILDPADAKKPLTMKRFFELQLRDKSSWNDKNPNPTPEPVIVKTTPSSNALLNDKMKEKLAEEEEMLKRMGQS